MLFAFVHVPFFFNELFILCKIVSSYFMFSDKCVDKIFKIDFIDTSFRMLFHMICTYFLVRFFVEKQIFLLLTILCIYLVSFNDSYYNI